MKHFFIRYQFETNIIVCGYSCFKSRLFLNFLQRTETNSIYFLYLGPAEKEVMQTEPVQVIVLILAEAPKTTPETLPICPLVEIPKGFSGP